MSDEKEGAARDKEYLDAGKIILDLLANQKNEIEKLFEETRTERVETMERSKSLIEKNIQEKAFMILKQKEQMAKNIKPLLNGPLGDVISKIDETIGIKAFLSGTQKDKISQLKKVQISADEFKRVQEQINATVATKAMHVDHAKATTDKMLATKDERIQRMKDAGAKLEKSDAFVGQALRTEAKKTQDAMLGSKEERQKHFKEAIEKLEKDPAFKKKVEK